MPRPVGREDDRAAAAYASSTSAFICLYLWPFSEPVFTAQSRLQYVSSIVKTWYGEFWIRSPAMNSAKFSLLSMMRLGLQKLNL